MRRRKFIKKFAGAVTVAGTLGVESMDAAQIDSKRDNSLENVEQLINRIDNYNAAIDSKQLFDSPGAFLIDEGYDSSLISGGVKAILFAGIYKDVDTMTQKHPVMQRRIENEAGAFEQTAISMATVLESINRKKRREIRDYLRKNPLSIRQFRDEFNRAGNRIKVPQKRMAHFNEIFDRMLIYLSRRSNWKLLDDYIDLVDQVILQDGITPNMRRKLARMSNEDAARFLEVASDDEYCGSNIHIAEASLQLGGDSYNQKISEKEKKRKRRIRRGLILMGIGGVSAGVMFPIGFSDFLGGTGGLVLGGTVGAILFISGLIVTIAGLSIRISERDSKGKRQRVPAYSERLQKAVHWVKNERGNTERSLEEIVVEATARYDVEFNDIWELLE